MHPEEKFRYTVSFLLLSGIGLNMLVFATTLRLRGKPRIDTAKLRVLGVYSLLAALTCTVAMYWRLADTVQDKPLNVGDFTVLIPVGFVFAGWFGARVLGRRVTEARVEERGVGCND